MISGKFLVILPLFLVIAAGCEVERPFNVSDVFPNETRSVNVSEASNISKNMTVNATRNMSNISKNLTNETQNISNGRVVFAVSAENGNFSSVEITLEGIEVMKEEGGWANISFESRSLDLVDLDDRNVLLADVMLKPGTYRQVRLNVSNVVVDDDSGLFDAEIASGEIVFEGKLIVSPNSTSTVLFEFYLEDSLRKIGSGSYFMNPVVELESRANATVMINDDEVDISEGDVTSSVINQNVTGTGQNVTGSGNQSSQNLTSSENESSQNGSGIRYAY
ncbi:DUF4382 domain-containing protein [Candidatus Woesearchaeota archaeon]|nr:DUF4382 domain-containing protein [Candidatus Woesearchaeota archaeon]